MAKQNLNFNVNFTATGNFNQLNSSLKRLKSAHAQAFGTMMSPQIASKSPFDEYAKGLNKGTLKAGELARVFRNMNPILAEHNALSRASGVVMKDAAGNAKVALGINRAFGATLVTNSQRLALFNTILSAGGRRMITWGKNVQWAGRQVMVGLTLPLAAFAAVSMRAFETFERQMTRVIKVTNVGLITMERFGEQISVFDVMDQTDFGLGRMELANDSIRRQTIALAEFGAELGFAADKTSELIAEFSQMGYMGIQLDQISQSALTLSRISGATLPEAIQLSRIVAQSFGVELQDLTQTFAELNLVENNTALSLKEMSEAIPIVASVADNMGLSVGATAGLLAIMKEKGIAAREGATALRTGLIKLVQEATPNAIAAFQDINLNLQEMQERHAGNVLGFMIELGSTLKDLSADTREGAARVEAFTAALAKLVGVRASARFLSLVQELDGLTATLNEFGQVEIDASNLDKQSRTYRAFMAEIEEEQARAARVFQRELDLIQNSQAGIASRLRAQLNFQLTKIGESFLIWANKIRQIIVNVLKAFNDLPEGLRQTIYWMGAILAAIGPVVMIGGVLANAFGQVINAFSKLLPKIKLMTAASRAEQLAHTGVSGAVHTQIQAKQQLIAVNGALVSSIHAVTAAQAAASAVPGPTRKKPFSGPTPQAARAFGGPVGSSVGSGRRSMADTIIRMMAEGAIRRQNLTGKDATAERKNFIRRKGNIAIANAAAENQARNVSRAVGRTASGALTSGAIGSILPGADIQGLQFRGPNKGVSVMENFERNLRTIAERRVAAMGRAGLLVDDAGKQLTGRNLTDRVQQEVRKMISEPDSRIVRRAAQQTISGYEAGERVITSGKNKGKKQLIPDRGSAYVRSLFGDVVDQPRLSEPTGRRKRLERESNLLKSQWKSLRDAGAEGLPSQDEYVRRQQNVSRSQRVRSRISAFRQASRTGATSLAPSYMEYGAARAAQTRQGIAQAFASGRSKVGVKAKDLAKKIPFGKSILTSLKSMKGSIGSMFGKAIGPAILKALGGAIGTLGAVVGTIGLPLALIFGPMIAANPKEFMEGMMGVLAKPLAGLKKSWQSLVDVIKVFIFRLRGAGKEGGGIFGQISKVIGKLVGLIGGALVRVITFIIDLITGIAQSLSGVFTIFGGIAKIFKGDFKEGFKMIWEGIKQVFEGLRTIAISAVQYVVNLLADIPLVGKLFQPLSDWLQKLKEGSTGLNEYETEAMRLDSAFRSTQKTIEEMNDEIAQGEELISSLKQYEIIDDQAVNTLLSAAEESLSYIRENSEEFANVSEMSTAFAHQTNKAALEMEGITDEQRLQLSLYAQRKALEAEFQRAMGDMQALQNEIQAAQFDGEEYLHSERVKNIVEEFLIRERFLIDADRKEAESIRGTDARREALDAVNARQREHNEMLDQLLSGEISAGLAVRASLGLNEERLDIASGLAEATQNDLALQQQALGVAGDMNDEVEDLADGMDDVNAAVSAFKSGMSEVMGDIESIVGDIARLQEEVVAGLFEELTDGISDFFSEYMDMMSDQFEAIEESIDAQYDAEAERIAEIYDSKINAIKDQMDEEERLEKLREDNFNKEKARIEFLKGLRVSEIQIQESILSGELGQAAILSVQRSAEIESFFMTNVEERYKEISELRKESMNSEMEILKEQRDAEIDGAESRRDAAKERISDAKDATREAADNARERADAEIEQAQRAMEEIREKEDQRIENYLREWRRVTPATEAELAEHNARLQSFMTQSSQRMQSEMNAVRQNLRNNLGSISSEFEGTNNDLVREINRAAQEADYSITSIADSMVMNSTNSLMASLDSIQQFVSGLDIGFTTASEISQLFLDKFEYSMESGFAKARDIAIDELTEQNKWERAGQDILAAINRGLREAAFADFDPLEYDWDAEKADSPMDLTQAQIDAYNRRRVQEWRNSILQAPANRSGNTNRYRSTTEMPVPGTPEYYEWLEEMGTPFAKGGIVTKPVFPALVGEAGPEAIIPLSKIGKVVDAINRSSYSYGTSASLSPSRSTSQGSSSTYNLSFNINGANLDEDKLAKRVMFEIQKTERSVGMGRRV